MADSDVVLLPITFDGDTPIYPESAHSLIAALRAADVSARTWHADPPEFGASRGPVTDALIQIAVGIASSGGWYAVQSLLERRQEKVHLIAFYEKDGQRFRLEVTGPARQIAEELRQLDPFRPEPPA
ncbi:hypothetical protein [Paractinoplanes lichenicola]|uniref:Uncharacterized protein n=1 Tax=Paractinoplanes lichenicola TaxID=2802976 RepID=A0ABS1VUZ3_9ACTN|nr:hypothetical protein [Actinoplanes lichenicola]MBL7258264.1 hypothetical protein [Actinoplanes lichenicola]